MNIDLFDLLSFAMQLGTLAALAYAHASMTKRSRQLCACAMDVFEAHELLLKARDVLSDHAVGFDAEHTAKQLRDYLGSKWEAMGITEEIFRRMAAKMRNRSPEQ